MTRPVLLIDDDPAMLELLELELDSEGIESITARSGRDALEVARGQRPSAVVLDLLLPDLPGIQVLRQLRERDPRLSVIVLTARGRVDEAVECMRLGAYDFIQKPIDRTRLVATLAAARRGVARPDDNQLPGESGLASVLGDATAWRSAVQLLQRAASSDVTVLLGGESGTGKEVLARGIHADSQRSSAPFVPINCGAIPDTLIEAELFGVEKGAYTGAEDQRPGLFEEASGGTVFLDEVGELRPDLQVRLLRVLQERVVQRLGSSKVHPVDVRVLAASNRELQTEIRAGRFREDLYYRLAVFPVRLPSLREREGDAELLANHFLERFAELHRCDIGGLSQDALRAIRGYPWPGNVRELENVMERAAILEDGSSVTLASLPEEVQLCVADVLVPRARVGAEGEAQSDQILSMAEEERRILARALRITGWNVTEAAARLGIGRATLYRRIDAYGLRRAREEERSAGQREAEPAR